MGTAVRKARKAEQRATGKAFTHPVKVGTPLDERSVPLVLKKSGGVLGHFPSSRATKKLADRAELLKEGND
jgi:hypothetical protein